MRQLQKDFADGKRFPRPKVTPELVNFARQYFKEISEETVQRNWLEIMNCKSENTHEMKTNSRYRTVMVLNNDGEINLVVRKIA